MARILIVDDHTFFRQGLAAALVSRGHDIAGSVGNGTDALQILSAASVDVVLLDLRMKGIDGVTMLRSMRAHRNVTPVIALTAELTDEALVGLMHASVNGIVFKHCSEDRLFEAIDAVLKGLRFVDGALVDKAFALSAAASPMSDGVQLTAREKLVVDFAVQGLRNREIADRSGISEAMVKLYLHKAYQKLGVGNRTELAALLSHKAP